MAKANAAKELNPPSFFELRSEQKGWNWVLWSKNGRAIATNADEYGSRHDAHRAIERFVAQMNAETLPILVNTQEVVRDEDR